MGCHATVFSGDANAGVSCETCHGAGSDYVEPHQQKGTHARSVTLGLFDTRGNLSVWAKMCVDCHIMKDAKLIAAGHKSGSGLRRRRREPEDRALGPELRLGGALRSRQGCGRTPGRRRAQARSRAAGGRAAAPAAAPKPGSPSLRLPASRPSPRPRPRNRPGAPRRPPSRQAQRRQHPLPRRAPRRVAEPAAPAPTPTAVPPRRALAGDAGRPVTRARRSAALPHSARRGPATPRLPRSQSRSRRPRFRRALRLARRLRGSPRASPSPDAGSGSGRRREPRTGAEEASGAETRSPQAEPRPTVRRGSPLTAAPAPTLTPTKRPAPPLPPQRAPN